MRLGKSTRRWALGLHLVFAASWLGGVIGLLILSLAHSRPDHDATLGAVRHSLSLLDYLVIIPACFGSLGTGLTFCWLTPWGFAKHRWVMVKWALTGAMILFGMFFLGPWVDESATLARDLGLAALDEPDYASRARLVTVFSVIQVALLVGLIFVSAHKPWGKRGEPAGPRRPLS